MTFPNSARDADAQLTAARGAAYAWLRATLASLPAAVTSLSVGCVLEDGDDRPNLAPRLRASVLDGAWNYPVDMNTGAVTQRVGAAMQALYEIDDDLRTHTAPFLFALGDEEFLTVTRADLAVTFNTAGIDPALSLQRDTSPRRWIASKGGMNPDGSISTTTRTVSFHGTQPIAAADGPVLAAIMQEIADLPRGEATTILCHRNVDGTLTWNVTAP